MADALPLKTSAKSNNLNVPNVLRVVDYQDFIRSGRSGSDYCLLLEPGDINVDAILELGWGGIIYPDNKIPPTNETLPVIYQLKRPEVVASGDIISASQSRIDVLFRKSSNSNMLFVTEQCNHNCIMCSQPPRSVDDSWRVDECKAIVSLIDDQPGQVLGISGGEPSLLGENLVRIIEHCKQTIPETYLHVLTNASVFSDRHEVERICSICHDKIIWGVPLFGSTPHLHDFHTQVKGSFDCTIHGLYNLALFDQLVELRVVLTKMVLENIEALSEFILRNLPFVHKVVLMGLEPTGYTRVNHQIVWADIEEHTSKLKNAVFHMQSSFLNVQLYNLPLCKLPEELHSIAVQSISDWKNIYHEDCSDCRMKELCCGFFKSNNAKFVKERVIPFVESV